MTRYENGKYLHKKNTFTDFIAVAEHLISEGLAKPERLCMEVRCACLAEPRTLRCKLRSAAFAAGTCRRSRLLLMCAQCLGASVSLEPPCSHAWPAATC